MKEKMVEQVNKNNMPKVSIGMPVYNGEKYIREALDSLLAQTFTDFELIISDNCSNDKTQEICLEYATKDSRIRYIRQIKNIEVIPNFEYVRFQAIGQYFMWAASDDKWSKKWLEDMYKKIVETNADAAFGQVLPINDKSEFITHIATTRTFKFIGNRTLRRLKFYLAYEGAGKANLIYSLFKVESLKQLKFNSDLYDYSVIYDFLYSSNIESVPSVYFYKRNHSEAFSSQFGHKKNKTQWVIRQIFPLPKVLFLEYFELSKWNERIFITIGLPIKFLFAYLARINALFLKN